MSQRRQRRTCATQRTPAAIGRSSGDRNREHASHACGLVTAARETYDVPCVGCDTRGVTGDDHGAPVQRRQPVVGPASRGKPAWPTPRERGYSFARVALNLSDELVIDHCHPPWGSASRAWRRAIARTAPEEWLPLLHRSDLRCVPPMRSAPHITALDVMSEPPLAREQTRSHEQDSSDERAIGGHHAFSRC